MKRQNHSVKSKEWIEHISLPKIIKIGYQDIKVSEMDFVDESQGVYRADQSEIRIREGLEAREKLNTVLHEILHAIVYSYGLKNDFKDDDEEEKVVNALGNGLTEAFIRNPELMEFIKNAV